jgi:arylsulfatase A-like enzyme
MNHPPDHRPTPAWIATVAVWCALATGIAQVIVLGLKWKLWDPFIWQSRDFIWMMPVGCIMWMALVAVPLILIALVRPSLLSRTFVAAVVGSFAALGVPLLFRGLYSWAAAALGIGAGIRMAKWLAARRRIGIETLALGILIAVVGGSAHLARTITERRTLGALPQAPAGSPNVLLIVLDAVRAANLSLYGHTRATTPNLDRRASQGVVFNWAFSTSAWTLPSHGSMFTGRYSPDLSTSWTDPLDETYPTLGEVLRSRGYATAAFVANSHYTSWHSGLGRGFTHLEDYKITPYGILISVPYAWTYSGERLRMAKSLRQVVRALVPDLRLQNPHFINDLKTASELRTDFLTWEATKGNRPFFAFLNVFDAHEFKPQGRFATLFGTDHMARTEYDRAIAYMDDEIEAILRELQRRGTLDNTVVIVTADHGEQFKDHNLMEHGNSLYTQLLRVPLYIRYPAKVPQGMRIDRPITLRDLPQTIIDLAGFETDTMPGRSLASTWTPGAPPAIEPIFAHLQRGIRTAANEPVTKGDLVAVIDDSLHYILNGDGAEELYAYRADPTEQRNLIAAPASKDGAARLRALARTHLTTPERSTTRR